MAPLPRIIRDKTNNSLPDAYKFDSIVSFYENNSEVDVRSISVEASDMDQAKAELVSIVNAEARKLMSPNLIYVDEKHPDFRTMEVYMKPRSTAVSSSPSYTAKVYIEDA